MEYDGIGYYIPESWENEGDLRDEDGASDLESPDEKPAAPNSRKNTNLQEWYTQCVETGEIVVFLNVIAWEGIAPKPETVQAAYREILARNKNAQLINDLFDRTYNLTGIKPALTNDGYYIEAQERALETRDFETLLNLLRPQRTPPPTDEFRRRATELLMENPGWQHQFHHGYSFDKSVLREGIEKALEEGNLYKILDYFVAGASLKASEKALVQQAYVTHIEKGRPLHEISDVFLATGISIELTGMKRALREAAVKGNIPIVLEAHEKFGVLADLDGPALQQSYLTALANGIDQFSRLYGLYNQPPTEDTIRLAVARILESPVSVTTTLATLAKRYGGLPLPDAQTLKQSVVRGLTRNPTSEKINSVIGYMDLADTSIVAQVSKVLIRQGRLEDMLRVAQKTSSVPLFEDEDVKHGYHNLLRKGKTASVLALQKYTNVPIEAETIQNVYEELLNKQDFFAIENIVRTFKVPPKLPTEAVQSCYRELLRHGHWTKLDQVTRATGIKVEPAIVQEVSIDTLERGAIDRLLVLLKFAPGQVTLPEAKVRAAQKRLVSEQDYPYCEHLILLTGIAPDEADMQEIYAGLLHFGDFSRIEQLRDATDIAPKFDHSSAERIFNKLTRVSELIRVSDMTGLVPPEAAITRVAKICFNDNDFEALIALKNAFGNLQEIPRKEVESKYLIVLVSGWAGQASVIEQVTNIQPSPEILQKVYRSLLDQGGFITLEDIQKKYNVYPSIETIDSAYHAWFQGTFSICWKRCMEKTELRPSEAVIKEAVVLMTARGNFNDAAWLQQKSGIELEALDPEIVQKAYATAIGKTGNIKENIEKIRKLTGIEMSDQAVSVAVINAWHSNANRVPELLLAFPNATIDWSQLDPLAETSVYASMSKIANKDLRAKALGFLSKKMVISNEEPEYADLKAAAPDMPPYTLGLLHRALPRMTTKFARTLNELAAAAKARKKGASEPMRRLEFSLSTFLIQLPRSHAHEFHDAIERVVENGASAEELAELCDALAGLTLFLQTLETTKPDNEYGYDEEDGGYGSYDSVALPGVVNQIPLPSSGEALKAAELIAWAKQAQKPLLERLLGYAPTIEQYRNVEAEWGSLRPLLVLASKYKSGYSKGMPLFSEAVKAIFEGTWGEFRYRNPAAEHLLNGLSTELPTEQQERWIENSPKLALEDVRVSEKQAEHQREAIKDQLTSALDQGYLYSAQHPETAWAHDAYVWARKAMKDEGGSYTRLEDAKILAGLELFRKTQLAVALKGLDMPTDTENVDLEILLHKGRLRAEVLGRELAEAKTAKKSVSKLETGLGRAEAVVHWAEEMARLGSEAEVLRRELDLGAEADIKKLVAVRDQLDLASDIVRLASISSGEVRRRGMRDARGILKRGALLRHIDNMKAKLASKSLAFMGTLENIAVLLHGTETPGSIIQGLTIEETDHPKDMIEMGKYPSGASSCQNFEGDVSFNHCLLAMMADADKKLILIRKQDGTIIARAVMKLVWLQDDTPALFLAPTYTSVSKADHDFDVDINAYAYAKAEEMGGVRVLRGSTRSAMLVKVRESRNGSQYEDGATGGPHDGGLGEKYGAYTMDAVEVAKT